MSVLKFELKNEHIKLLKQLKWSSNNKVIVSVEDISDPLLFNESNVYEAVDLILNGIPANIDPLNTSEFPVYTPEQITEWDKLLSELPTALDIILYNEHFNVGKYKTRYHLREWKQIQEVNYEI